ncbi:RNA methyltransferase [Hazenella sp. IB182357]|uniref:RNA methyltransferase n=1 Tax=Polycladospora coralii TaxID=2771432 RepID=A0A926NAE6_9BACL|nr:RNA methyltransferase [Polycladospora coralii]MBD1372818.1 RNA methyltransferase [Polycladospora coralii]MBS7529484.1 RNA methyltransferase [Polycladospora coralii]
MTNIHSITSPQNQHIKNWKKLQTKKGRFQRQELFIEGEHLILEAIKAKQPFLALIIAEDAKVEIQDLKNHTYLSEIDVYYVSPSIFQTLTETNHPQGLAAVIKLPTFKLDEIWSSEAEGLYLLLDAIQDPGNLGTIIRTAEAAGVRAVFLGEGTVDPFNAKVVRSAMGSLFRVPLLDVDLTQIIPLLEQKRITVMGTSPHAGTFHYNYSYARQCAILLGNEARGVQPALLEQIDQTVQIPMLGQTESLNVSVTASVLLYEYVRQVHMASRM